MHKEMRELKEMVGDVVKNVPRLKAIYEPKGSKLHVEFIAASGRTGKIDLYRGGASNPTARMNAIRDIRRVLSEIGVEVREKRARPENAAPPAAAGAPRRSRPSPSSSSPPHSKLVNKPSWPKLSLFRSEQPAIEKEPALSATPEESKTEPDILAELAHLKQRVDALEELATRPA